jgi:hypothetical protein
VPWLYLAGLGVLAVAAVLAAAALVARRAGREVISAYRDT